MPIKSLTFHLLAPWTCSCRNWALQDKTTRARFLPCLCSVHWGTQRWTERSSLSPDYSTPTSYQALTWWLSSPLAHVPSLECLPFPLLAYSSSPWAKWREEMTEKAEKQKVSSDLSFEAVLAVLISSVNASPIITGKQCHQSLYLMDFWLH